MGGGAENAGMDNAAPSSRGAKGGEMASEEEMEHAERQTHQLQGVHDKM